VICGALELSLTVFYVDILLSMQTPTSSFSEKLKLATMSFMILSGIVSHKRLKTSFSPYFNQTLRKE